jgi:hypothetical protein
MPVAVCQYLFSTFFKVLPAGLSAQLTYYYTIQPAFVKTFSETFFKVLVRA